MPSSARRCLTFPSKSKGFVTTPTVRFAGYLCDDGNGSGTGTAAHAGGDEHHVGAADRVGDGFRVFHGGLFADFGLAAGAETSGQLRPDGEFEGCVGIVQCLQIRIGDEKIHVLETGSHHAVDRIRAAAAGADYLDYGRTDFFVLKYFIVHEFSPPRKN